MRRIGILGDIGSGKSFIANRIAEVILGKLLVDDRNFN